jgi:hypothetical protein
MSLTVNILLNFIILNNSVFSNHHMSNCHTSRVMKSEETDDLQHPSSKDSDTELTDVEEQQQSNNSSNSAKARRVTITSQDLQRIVAKPRMRSNSVARFDTVKLTSQQQHRFHSFALSHITHTSWNI